MEKQAKKIEELFMVIKELKEKEARYLLTINQLSASTLPGISLISDISMDATNTLTATGANLNESTSQVNTNRGLKCTLQKKADTTSPNAVNMTATTSSHEKDVKLSTTESVSNNHSNTQLHKNTQKIINKNKSNDSNQVFQKSDNTLVT